MSEIQTVCVEDERDVRELIVEELEEAGIRVLQAENGKEGLDKILTQRPDIVISDITMPEMDGHELLAEIQINYPEFSNIPFILLTALTDRDNMIAGLKGGAADYLTKPIDFDVLLAKVAGCVVRLENDHKTGRSF